MDIRTCIRASASIARVAATDVAYLLCVRTTAIANMEALRSPRILPQGRCRVHLRPRRGEAQSLCRPVPRSFGQSDRGRSPEETTQASRLRPARRSAASIARYASVAPNEIPSATIPARLRAFICASIKCGQPCGHDIRTSLLERNAEFDSPFTPVPYNSSVRCTKRFPNLIGDFDSCTCHSIAHDSSPQEA